jgi:hypothetical protein
MFFFSHFNDENHIHRQLISFFVQMLSFLKISFKLSFFTQFINKLVDFCLLNDLKFC